MSSTSRNEICLMSLAKCPHLSHVDDDTILNNELGGLLVGLNAVQNDQ